MGQSQILNVARKPIVEPVAKYSPFVMNTQQEIQEAVYFIKENNMAIGPRLVMPIRTILQEEVCLHADGIEEVKS